MTSLQVYGKRDRDGEDLPPAKYSRTDNTTGNFNGRPVISLGDMPAEIITQIIAFLPQKAATAFSLTSTHNYAQTIRSVSDIVKTSILSNLEVLKKNADWIDNVQLSQETGPQEPLPMMYQKFRKDQMACLFKLSQVIDITTWQKFNCSFSNFEIDWFNTFIFISSLKQPLNNQSQSLIDASSRLDKENLFELINWFIDHYHGISSNQKATTEASPTHTLNPMALTFSSIFTKFFQYLLKINNLALLSDILDRFGTKIISVELFNPLCNGIPVCISNMISNKPAEANNNRSKIRQFIDENELKLSPLTQDLFQAALISEITSNTANAPTYQAAKQKLTAFQCLYASLSSSLIKDRCMQDFISLLVSLLYVNGLKLAREQMNDNEIEGLLKICFKLTRAIESAGIRKQSLKKIILLENYYHNILIRLIPTLNNAEIDEWKAVKESEFSFQENESIYDSSDNEEISSEDTDT